MILGRVVVITTGVVLVLAGPSGFLKSWPVAITIALVTATICYWGVHAVSWVESAVLRWRGGSEPQHGAFWYLLLTALWMPLGIHLGFGLAAIVGDATGRPLSQPDWSDYRHSLFFGLLVCGVMFLFEMQREAKLAQKEADLRLREAENARLKAQVAGLTAQMNPHLLFNALNTVASLIRNDPDAAEEMTVCVADMLRSRLQAGRQEMHSLEQELAICANYLEIEKHRFGDRLATDTDLSGVDIQAVRVPVLCVQPLVENAVKYAIAPRASGGQILIRVDQSQGLTTITVSDDGPGPGDSPATPGSQTSIENCRKRLDLHYGGEASLVLQKRDSGGCEAVLKIPRQSLANSKGLAEKGEARS
jgi:two-component sensor histidine kinase